MKKNSALPVIPYLFLKHWKSGALFRRSTQSRGSVRPAMISP